MQGLTKFEKWIKIRIGEPITALDIREDYVAFGSISGYVGFYNINRNDLKYIQEVFEEIIRGIHILPNLHCYITVGDYQGLNMDIQRREWDVIRYDRRPHNPTLCSSTIALLKNEKVILLTVAPTQNKDLVIDITTKKNSLYVVDLQAQEVTHHNVDMPQLCVPFDYDGNRLLLLEYLKGGKKQLLMYDFHKQSMDILYAIPQNIEFISFGKLAGNYIIFVQDHKKVKAFDLKTKNDSLLYTMDQNIIALDIELPESQNEESKEMEQQQEISLSDIQVCTVDYNATFRCYHKSKLVHNFNLLKYLFRIPNVAEDLVRHKYLFDMGYPYYLKFRNTQLAITSDLGILVYTV